MKRLWFMITAFCLLPLSVSAVDYQPYRPSQAQMQGYDANALNAQAPDYQFGSTSAMTQGDYTVSFAASDVAGGVTTVGEPSVVTSGPHRIGGRPDYEEEDPEMFPVGDTPWLWMLGMVALYAALRLRRTKNA